LIDDIEDYTDIITNKKKDLALSNDLHILAVSENITPQCTRSDRKKLKFRNALMLKLTDAEHIEKTNTSINRINRLIGSRDLIKNDIKQTSDIK
jgi:hypothetical protein